MLIYTSSRSPAIYITITRGEKQPNVIVHVFADKMEPTKFLWPVGLLLVALAFEAGKSC